MKEFDFRKIISPFKDIFDNPVVTKSQAGIQDFVDGVKNLFRQNDERPASHDINNYLKSPDEIEAELRFIGDNQKNYIAVSDNSGKPEFLKTSFVPSNIKTLEEALCSEMEENY